LLYFDGQLEEVLQAADPHMHDCTAVVQHLWESNLKMPNTSTAMI
jgi:hypothetical protein